MQSLTSPAVARRPRAFVRVAGPDAADYLQRMVSNDVTALVEGERCDALLLTAKARVIAPLRVLRRGRLVLGGDEVVDARPPGEEVGEEELERWRIESGIPRWGHEIDDRILPAEAGLDETHISFSKGCYPGQEPIARQRHRGKVNRKLRVLEIDGEAARGDELLLDGKKIGRITSAVPGLALGYVRVEVPNDAQLELGAKTGFARVR